MNVSVVDLSANQKKIQVEIPAQRVQDELEKRYRELSKQARIRGFRPGKVPRSILKSYYGKSIENEVSSQFINDTYPEAIKEAQLKPLAEADVTELRFEESGAFTYTAVVDVCPPFEVQDYAGMEVSRQTVEVSEEEVASELERIREQHAQLRSIEEERPVKEGDVVLVDFVPSVDGKVFERGKTTGHMVEIGKQALHPEFDDKLIGHKPGETVSFDLDYPEDAPTEDIAGKTVHFEVTINEIKEKDVPELNDEFAKTAGQFDSVEALTQSIRERITKREEEKISQEVRRQLVEGLLDKIQIELPAKAVEREVENQIGMLQQQFERQGLKIDASRFDTPEIRAEYRPSAEKNLRRRLILDQIAKQENIELTPEEFDEIYNQVARFARMDAATVKEEYADSPIVDQAKESRIHEKVLKLLEDQAVFTEEEKKEEPSDKE